MAEFNTDTFGKIMDDFMKNEDVKMLIELPEGTLEPVIQDNTGLGPVIWFYILLQAMGPIYKTLYDKVLDHSKHEEFIDGILKLLKKHLMETVEG